VLCFCGETCMCKIEIYIYIYIYIVHFVVEAVCVHVWQICGPILDVHMLLVFDKKCECDLC